MAEITILCVSRSRMRFFPISVFVSLLFLFIYLLAPSADEHIEHNDPIFDIYLFSTYYYPKSKSFGDDSIATVMTTDFGVLRSLGHLQFIGVNSTIRATHNAKLERITPHDVCKWIAITSSTQIGVQNLQNLYISMGDKHAKIPFEMAETRRRPVVMCISPLFAAENWQNMFLALHVYKKFGGFVQLYIRSVISPLLEILKIYERHNYVHVKPWPRIELLGEQKQFNPNLNVEFRSQAAAHTDCLLKYKEASDYVAFLDLDDLLIPKESSYAAEFEHIWQPSTAYMLYSKKNFKYELDANPHKFSLAATLDSLEAVDEFETGKIVAKTAAINGTWIHLPSTQVHGESVDKHWNTITHLKYKVAQRKRDNGEMMKRRSIEQDYKRMSWKKSIRRHYPHLPRHFTLSAIISRCFSSTFYQFDGGDQAGMLCPGPERCRAQLDAANALCQNGVGEYHSTHGGAHFNIHFVKHATFQLSSCHA